VNYVWDCMKHDKNCEQQHSTIRFPNIRDGEKERKMDEWLKCNNNNKKNNKNSGKFSPFARQFSHFLLRCKQNTEQSNVFFLTRHQSLGLNWLYYICWTVFFLSVNLTRLLTVYCAHIHTHTMRIEKIISDRKKREAGSRYLKYIICAGHNKKL